MKNSFFYNSLVSLFAYALSTGLTLCFSVGTARVLGPSGNGSLALLILFGTIIGMAANFGLGQAAVYYLGRQTYPVASVVNNLWTVALAVGVTVALLLVGTVPLYHELFLRGIPREQLILMAAITPFILGKLYAEYIFIGLQDFIWHNSINIVDLGAKLLLFLMVLPFRPKIEQVLLIVVVAAIGSCIVGWLEIRRRLGSIALATDAGMLSRFVQYGLPSYSTVLISFLNLRLDQFLISRFLPLDQLGLYAVAVIVAELPMKLSNALAKVLFSRVSTLDGNEATKLTGRIMRMVVTLAVIIAAIVFVLCPWLLGLVFGAAYIRASTALWLLLPGAILFNYSQILYSDLSGRGYPIIGTYAGILSIIATIVGNVCLVPFLGIEGAALTSSIAYFLSAVVMISFYMRVSGQPIRELLWITMADVRVLYKAYRQAFADK